METPEELSAFLAETTVVGYRGRLQARGKARALIRSEGILPLGAPAFSQEIDLDLADYAFSLLRASMAARELGCAADVWRSGFLKAADAFEALVQNGSSDDISRGFLRVLGAASYHLASYSALAFSLLSQAAGSQNFSPAENALSLLIVRDLRGVNVLTKQRLLDAGHGDTALAAGLAAGEIDTDDVVADIAVTTMFRALAFFEFALQTGAEQLMVEARNLLRRAVLLTKHGGAIPIWWILRIASNLIDDLWAHSLHRVLPLIGPPGATDYGRLRKIFIGELFSRSAAEVELWPSQLQAAQRAANVDDDLVVALPTSAGKTRIAEMAALMALAKGQRVLVVTPLRALSAQTERSFRKTFSPLGFTVSALYGSSGVAGTDEDALREQEIVIATPEKLDFSLRNDPTIINNVGLIVLDEGHMIGPSEREIRYESLVQRLLRRHDHANRRIVCLSAILPEGDQLNDLTAWIRSDAPGLPIQSSWRPTRQRFGTLIWRGSAALLSFDLESDAPFIPQFITEMPAIYPRRTPFPRDNKELTLAAAWKFSSQGKRALIFCTQRDHVEGFAEAALDVQGRGFLPALLDEPQIVEKAMAVGREWLGEDHPAVRCLSIGVAVHHGRLPSPFLRELEILLSKGVLRVIIASPTLTQGLNLNAAVLLIPNLYRAGKIISGEEFANVAGRAGRAFVDLEGLIIHVMHNPDGWRQTRWRDLVNSARVRSLSSGIISVVDEVIRRLAVTQVFSRVDAMAYLSNTQEAWFPRDTSEENDSIESLIERLDATVLGLIEALDSDSAELPRQLDQALNGSLWARQISRFSPDKRLGHLWILESRARLIWNKTTLLQRKAQFAMGVGLESGLAISLSASVLTNFLDIADACALQGDIDGLTYALSQIGSVLLQIRPFVPDDPLPLNWQSLLRIWLSGEGVNNIGLDNMRIVEDVFIYRMVWALEALRMNRRANGGESEIIEGTAAACLETGLPRNMMAMLVRAGLPSRTAAKIAIEQLNPNFVTRRDLYLWLQSWEVAQLDSRDDWPTADTAAIWRRFRSETLDAVSKNWERQEWDMNLSPNAQASLQYPGRIEVDHESGQVAITTPDYQPLVAIRQRLANPGPGLLQAEFADDGASVRIVRSGQDIARWIEPI